ncbi:hypothetical protein HPB52_007874 [Rhipicephalus sanguineus]|uniref:ITPR-interacting domain-containing protein n=1 Tax=Rhipicephalus sanguineus TaxID=34632 RepID=A0A9D4QLU5_RHISA|nr:hypothetical protein HPB52_007874 [Rhipicephalus sanguineus]
MLRKLFHFSVESLLEARREDPEELLLALGFGGPVRDENPVSRIPERFLAQPSQARGVDMRRFVTHQEQLSQRHEAGLPGQFGEDARSCFLLRDAQIRWLQRRAVQRLHAQRLVARQQEAVEGTWHVASDQTASSANWSPANRTWGNSGVPSISVTYGGTTMTWEAYIEGLEQRNMVVGEDSTALPLGHRAVRSSLV